MRERIKYDLVNKALKGRLDYQLRSRRERGDTIYAIAYWVRHQTGISVTPQSVSVWCQRALAEAVE